MKKILLSLILITYTNHLISQQYSGYLTLPQEESEIWAYLNDIHIENKLFYKKLSNADLTLCLDILSEEIRLLNQERLHKNSEHNQFNDLFSGLISLSLAIYFSLEPGQALYDSYNQFKSGKFKDIHIPFYLIEKLSSTTISQEEKQYLKRFSFEKIYFDYKKDPFFKIWSTDPQTGKIKIINQDDAVEDRIARLSSIEIEKIMYLALRSAITDLKWQATTSACAVLMCLGVAICCCAPLFKKAFSYEVEDQAKLNVCKKLYNILEKEHADRSLHLIDY